MSKFDRLFQLVQFLRRHRNPVTAEAIAVELEVSVRTVYRDVAALLANRVPVRGEAGMGYVLEDGFDLPPMMFTVDEIEAILLGMRWLGERGDPALARGASNVRAKIAAILPPALKPTLLEGALFAPFFGEEGVAVGLDEGLMREAIRGERKLAIAYADQAGQSTRRVIWPFGLAYFNASRVIMAWCELRKDFRHFRTDRVQELAVVDARYAVRRAELLRRWRRQVTPDGAQIRMPEDG